MSRTSRWRRGDYTTKDQLAHLRQQIEAAEAELIEREAELVDLRAEVFAFQLEYDTRVGRKEVELEEIEAEIKRGRQKLGQYRQRGAGGPSQTRISAGYVPVEEQYRRMWQQPRQPPPPPPAKPVDAATEAQIKTLYRTLCRRFHPDLAPDPAEQVWRTEMMTAVNAAYSARSLVELQALAERPDCSSSVEAGTDEQRLAALRDKLQQIQRRLLEVEREIRELTDGQMIELSLEIKFARRQGRDLLAEMATDVEEDLARKRVELDLVVAELERLGVTS